MSRSDPNIALWIKGTHVLLHINAVKTLLHRKAADDEREAGNPGISQAVLLARQAVKAALGMGGVEQARQAAALSAGAVEVVTVVPRKRKKHEVQEEERDVSFDPGRETASDPKPAPEPSESEDGKELDP